MITRALAAFAAACPLALPGQALAQTPEPLAEAALAAAEGPGAISYPPAFFAAARPTTALEMIERLPGFVLDGGDNVRGFEGAAGNVLIDGRRPASKSDDLEEILRRIPASQVARIDLIRGGAPGIDMQGKSVLANLIRTETSAVQGLVALAGRHVYDGRNLLGLRIEGSGRMGQTAWEAGFVGGQGPDDGAGDGPRIRTDGTGLPLIASFVDSEGTGTNGALTGAVERPLGGGQFRANGRLFVDHFTYDELNLGPVTREVSREVFDLTETELGASFTRPLGPRTSLEVIGLRQTADETIESQFDDPTYRGRFDLESQTTETIGRGVLRWRQTEALSWEIGAEGAINTLESATAFAENGVPVALPAANVEVEERRGEAFAKLAWRASPRLTLDGGLRFEASDISSEGDVELEKSLQFAKPQLSLTWAQDEHTQLRFRVERTVGQLDFDDFVASSSLNTGVLLAGNPDLDPAQEWIVEAAVERRFWTGGALVVTLRRAEIIDVADRAPVRLDGGKIYDAPANIGSGVREELALTLTLPFDRLGLKGAQLRGEGTWRNSEVEDPTTGESREISGLRPVEWEAHFTQDLPSMSSTWGIDVFGGWRETYYRYDEVSTTKLRPFVVPYVEWKPRADIVLRFEIPNVTERGLRRTRTVYAGPRDSADIAYVDDRHIDFGRMYRVRISKTLGG
ncbi:TonB-dependent siderophore receptor [Phenylobacterium sp.]|uniref:TonB-dependent receptor plug domain-containing protein n=1 Tax=Phenylobacterium sp. TaxID=1871053 RepID=UPI0027306A3C|nr:TonB-dependent receptor [Phenylobacterium sp.]MDP1618186.1 TonB-dependent receptor [Phenylobacterium sp.]MDP1988997.1 TonB-dependent receptor [Phenylobacterium sp.]